jgi:DHA2 family methylenomycin A resistance protein-like MFS transporter
VNRAAARSNPNLTLVAMCIAQAMILLDNTIVNVALPSIQHDLVVTPGNLEWIVNAYVLALASLILVGGTLGDRYGRRRLMLIGLTVFTVMSAACALSTDEHVLIIFRALQGIGAAIVAPLTLSILSATFAPERRASAFGIWAAAAGLGFGAGPIVGGLLLSQFGWSSVFWVNVPIGVAGVLMVAYVVPESHDPAPRRLDLPGSGLISAALLVLTFAVIETDEAGWLSGQTVGLLVAAVVMLVAFVWHERRTAEPMLPLDFFRSARFSVASGVYAVMYLALAGVFFFVTLLFQDVKGWSALRLGMSWLVMNVPFLAISVFAGRLTRRIGTATCWLGVLLGGLGILDFARLDAGSSFWQAVPGYLLIGFGYGMAVPTLSAAAMQSVPAERSGVGAGVLNTARQAGASVGLAVLGSISLSFVTRAWNSRIPQLPAGSRDAAHGLVERVAGGEAAAIQKQLGGNAFHLAVDSFVPGMRAALLVAGILMLMASAGAFLALRSPRPVAAPAAGEALSHQPTLARYDEAR